jgi:hypothetical protein
VQGGSGRGHVNAKLRWQGGVQSCGGRVAAGECRAAVAGRLGEGGGQAWLSGERGTAGESQSQARLPSLFFQSGT